MRLLPSCLAPCLLLQLAIAHAQTPPDSGALLQQIERNKGPALPAKGRAALVPAPAPLDKLSGATVTVGSFYFHGNTLIDSATLAATVASFVQRPLSFKQLQQAAEAVTELYRQRGWIVRAYLPRQEMDGGVVTIEVIEAVFGGARIEGSPPQRMPLERILSVVDANQQRGAALNADAIDRALLLVDDFPGVTAGGNLAAGENERETVLVLKLGDEPAYTGDAGVDNTGARSTGSTRLTANLTLNSPFHLGDQLGANLIHADGSDYARLAYGVPVGNRGWRAGANASALAYRLVADEFAALHGKGTSDTAGLEANYPLIRSRLRNLYLALNLDDKRFDNQANLATTSHYAVRTVTAGLSGNLFDNLGGGGANSASFALVRGRLDLDGSPNQAADAASTGSAGNFFKIRYSASRQQTITDAWSVYALVSGQSANKNLDSSEKFYLGGNYGVRAYPSSEAGGTNGHMLNLELRGRLTGELSLVSFFDYGHVTVNQNNDFAGGAARNSYALKGAGLSLGWISGVRMNMKASWARRIGGNPNPGANGGDQDGTLHKNRFWLQATLQF